MGNCIDVSEHNGVIDWNSVKEHGIDYAFIRCGFGQDIESQDDKYFDINMIGAIDAGIKVGVYFYSYATDYDSAASEAEHCIRLIEPYRDKISFPVFYDLEEERNKKRIIDIVDGFRNKLEYHGYNVGCYVAVSWYNEFFKDVNIDYIWLAYLGKTKPDYCDIWQYSWTENIAGAGCVDADILYNTDMRLLINSPKPAPAPIEKTVNIDVLVDAPEDITVNVNIHRVSNN